MEIDFADFIAAANPSVVTEIIALVRRQEAELLAIHRVEAGERLRADQGWQRYESVNKQLRALEVKLAAQAVGVPPYTHAMKMAGYDVSCKYGVYEARAFDLADEMYSSMLAAAPAPAGKIEDQDIMRQMRRRTVMAADYAYMLAAAPAPAAGQEEKPALTDDPIQQLVDQAQELNMGYSGMKFITDGQIESHLSKVWEHQWKDSDGKRMVRIDLSKLIESVRAILAAKDAQ